MLVLQQCHPTANALCGTACLLQLFSPLPQGIPPDDLASLRQIPVRPFHFAPVAVDRSLHPVFSFQTIQMTINLLRCGRDFLCPTHYYRVDCFDTVSRHLDRCTASRITSFYSQLQDKQVVTLYEKIKMRPKEFLKTAIFYHKSKQIATFVMQNG